MHLGFAILAIDALFWLLGEYAAKSQHYGRMTVAALIGFLGFIGSWIVGGYYYVVYYGPLVKPVIKAGSVPWAHAIAMETKEHIFLFIPFIALTILFIVLVKGINLRRAVMWLTGLAVVLALSIGAMGYIISAAARWGGFI